MVLSWTLDKLGPLCLSADDCGLVLEAIAGADTEDPATTDMPYRYDIHASVGQRFKLAVLKNVTEGRQEAVVANFERALDTLADVADIEEIEFPEMPYEAVTRTILNAESASVFEDFIESGAVAGLTAPGVPPSARALDDSGAGLHPRAANSRQDSARGRRSDEGL